MLFITIGISSVAFVLSFYLALRGKRDRFYWTLCAVLIGLGESCWVAFALSQSYVDQESVLREPFNLIPLGALFVGLGIAGVVWRGFRLIWIGLRPKNRGVHENTNFKSDN